MNANIEANRLLSHYSKQFPNESRAQIYYLAMQQAYSCIMLTDETELYKEVYTILWERSQLPQVKDEVK